jgi:hypothetical protein
MSMPARWLRSEGGREALRGMPRAIRARFKAEYGRRAKTVRALEEASTEAETPAPAEPDNAP